VVAIGPLFYVTAFLLLAVLAVLLAGIGLLVYAKALRTLVVLIAVAAGLGLAFVGFARHEFRSECGFSCGAVSSVEDAPGSEDPYEVCRRVGVKRLARDLSTRANPADVALAWARHNSSRNPEVRQEAIERCRRGLESG
jgi:hypothetical protein